MEVEKQPSPWPCVVMLCLLVLCCLAAPHYWQSTTPADQAGTEFSARPLAGPAHPMQLNLFNTGQSLFDNVPNNGFQALWTPPTVGELVVGPSTSNPFDVMGRRSDEPLVVWPSSASFGGPGYGASPHSVNSTQQIDIEPFAADSFEYVGATAAMIVPFDLLGQCVHRLADEAPKYVAEWSNITPNSYAISSPRPRLLLTQPGDRLAMLPEPPRKAAWCVPQTLYDQLTRLSEPAYSANWASHVSNQLHALTEREELEGEDVQSILADLGDATQEALILAESTDDDRLRVELLRAHWALARRLDCWGAMHEVRVAFRVRGRVAARGELSPYFNSDPTNAPTVDVAAFGRQLEAYEKTRDPRIATEITQQQRALASSPESFDRTLADSVEQHYRNANMRVAITGELVNRMIHHERTESRPVHEAIAGAMVHGQSEINSQSNVRLAPAENEWHMRVETNGVVESSTMASAGPVRLRSQSSVDFSGSKSVVVRPDGVHLHPADISINTRSRLLDVTTDYDWIPMVGSVTRDRAIEQYHAKQGFVRDVMEMRISDETSDRLDRETHDAMERARQNIYDRFTKDFSQYGLKLTTIEMKSSPERMVARVRVATDDQLGSHTPRPRALSDSMASMQLHETAMNNLAITLGLNGQQLTGDELREKLRARFPSIAKQDEVEPHRDTVFHFVDKDAVQFRINDGQLELKVLFKTIELDGSAMSDVTVHVNYTPMINGLNADLKRNGALGVEGRLSASERARLHNIFKEVFPPDRPLRLAHLSEENDHRFDGLMITQLVLEDGWLGLAIGPETSNRVAERSRSLR